MKRPTTPLLILALAVLASSAVARAEDDAGLAAMQALAFFEGDWEGEGWSRHGPEEPQQFRSRETVGLASWPTH